MFHIVMLFVTVCLNNVLWNINRFLLHTLVGKMFPPLFPGTKWVREEVSQQLLLILANCIKHISQMSQWDFKGSTHSLENMALLKLYPEKLSLTLWLYYTTALVSILQLVAFCCFSLIPSLLLIRLRETSATFQKLGFRLQLNRFL